MCGVFFKVASRELTAAQEKRMHKLLKYEIFLRIDFQYRIKRDSTSSEKRSKAIKWLRTAAE